MRICHAFWNAADPKRDPLFVMDTRWSAEHFLVVCRVGPCFSVSYIKWSRDCMVTGHYIHVCSWVALERRGPLPEKGVQFIPKIILGGLTGIVQERCRSKEWVCDGNSLLSVVIRVAASHCILLSLNVSCWLCSPVAARCRINDSRLRMWTRLCFVKISFYLQRGNL